MMEYDKACEAEELARLRRVLLLRAMLAGGASQRQVAEALGVSQSAISQRLASAAAERVNPMKLVMAGGDILRDVAAQNGYTDLAVFGSVARGEARDDSDVDLLVQAPPGTTLSRLSAFEETLEAILGCSVDLVSYGGLKPGVDDDIRRDAVPL